MIYLTYYKKAPQINQMKNNNIIYKSEMPSRRPRDLVDRHGTNIKSSHPYQKKAGMSILKFASIPTSRYLKRALIVSNL